MALVTWFRRIARELSKGRFDLFIQVMIVTTIITFSIQTLPELPPGVRTILHWIEVTTVLLFTLEYILRFVAAEKKLAFVFSFFGLIDLLAIIPFYVIPAVDLRALRTVRLLRLFQILRLTRYNRAWRRIGRAFFQIKAELTVYLSATIVLIFLASVGIYHCERYAQPEKFGSVFHAMWWAVVSLTTVGYGDVYPVTVGGRIFTGVVVILGVGVISVPSGLLAAALTATKEEEAAPPEEEPAGTEPS